jgi:hypothetical protein
MPCSMSATANLSSFTVPYSILRIPMQASALSLKSTSGLVTGYDNHWLAVIPPYHSMHIPTGKEAVMFCPSSSLSPHNLLQSVFSLSLDVESGLLPFVPSQVPKHYLSIHAVGPCCPDVEIRPGLNHLLVHQRAIKLIL